VSERRRLKQRNASVVGIADQPKVRLAVTKSFSVGLDVHARSVLGCALDGETGEIVEHRMTPMHAEIIEWVQSFPGPVGAVYEAGPTGFGLARAFSAAGIDCQVLAPSKLIRPSGDGVKTDARIQHRARRLPVSQAVDACHCVVGRSRAYGRQNNRWPRPIWRVSVTIKDRTG
jgi:hypothetical protein